MMNASRNLHLILNQVDTIQQLVTITTATTILINRFENIYFKCLLKVVIIVFISMLDIFYMPVSGFTGLNLKDRVSKDICPWYR